MLASAFVFHFLIMHESPRRSNDTPRFCSQHTIVFRGGYQHQRGSSMSMSFGQTFWPLLFEHNFSAVLSRIFRIYIPFLQGVSEVWGAVAQLPQLVISILGTLLCGLLLCGITRSVDSCVDQHRDRQRDKPNSDKHQLDSI